MTALEQAILEIGLEDLIPLPELLAMPEIRDVVGCDPEIELISDALVALLRRGLISVWEGHWTAEPQRVSPVDAEKMLRDTRRYSFAGEARGLQRTYFANVNNVP